MPLAGPHTNRVYSLRDISHRLDDVHRQAGLSSTVQQLLHVQEHMSHMCRYKKTCVNTHVAHRCNLQALMCTAAQHVLYLASGVSVTKVEVVSDHFKGAGQSLCSCGHTHHHTWLKGDSRVHCQVQ